MFVKSSRPTYKRRVKKAQEGIKFATYTPVEVNQTDYRDLTSIDNPFNEFNFATTYDKPTALVVPETTETKNEVETKSEPVVVNNPTPPVVVNKPTQNVSTSTTWRSPYKDKAKWTKDLSDAYRKVGITNDNAIRMLLAQDALESGWGKSAQGKYNFGNLTTGSSWKGNYVVGNDKNAKGEAIKQKFRAYESMDDYAKDKIQFLKRLYDFDENDDINKFVAKLTGSNKGKRKYAEASNYAKLLTGVYNGIPKGENGMIVKYQEPAQPIKYMGGYDKKGTMVLPVTNENGMNNVTLPEVTVTTKNVNLAGAVDKGRREAVPYVSTLLTGAVFGPLSVAGGYAGNGAVNNITNVASNGKYNNWSDMMSKTTGMNPVLADFFNIGNLAGGFGMRNFGPKLNVTGDAYTTIGGKFGYYGNPIQRVWHTVGRNKNWKTSAKQPELMRKLEDPIKVNSNGTLQVTNPNPRFSTPITNFTTDRPVVPHSWSWDMRDLYIFDPKITKGMKPASIEPSDTFYPNVNITAKPSQTTLVSGNPLQLVDAKSKGISTLSSPEARRLYQEAQWKYLGDLRKWKENMRTATGANRRFLEQQKPMRDNYGAEYAKEIQKLQSQRGTPTMKDYNNLESQTGLKAGVTDENIISKFEQHVKDVDNAITNWDYDFISNNRFSYPNGRMTEVSKYPEELEMMKSRPYNKIYYDPATWAEFNYRSTNNTK